MWSFAIHPRLVRANPLVREDAGRVAVERGPLVYCLEQPDQPDLNLFDASLLDDGPAFTGRVSRGSAGRRGGAEASRRDGGPAVQRRAAVSGRLNARIEGPGKKVVLTFIPYYAWANRGNSKMEVWIPYTEAGAE
jgi:uncharacterized protein